MILPETQLSHTLALGPTWHLVPNLTRDLRPAMLLSPTSTLNPSPIHLPTVLHKGGVGSALRLPGQAYGAYPAYPQGVPPSNTAIIDQNYPEKTSRGLGITQVVMGALCIALQAVSIGFDSL